MTTTDNFTEAARAEAGRRVPLDGGEPDLIFRDRRELVEMAEWARTHLAAQEPTDAEVEAKIQADTDSLAAEIHEAVEFQYDQCDHGTYHGGHMHGEPYQMCRINAERIVRRRAARRDEETARMDDIDDAWGRGCASLFAARAARDAQRDEGTR